MNNFTIGLETDTGIRIAAMITRSKSRDPLVLQICGSLPDAAAGQRYAGVTIAMRHDEVEVALLRSICNAAILWKGCNDRLDNGERDSLATIEYEAICETIRYGIAALMHRFPQSDYAAQRDIANGLDQSILTSLTVAIH